MIEKIKRALWIRAYAKKYDHEFGPSKLGRVSGILTYDAGEHGDPVQAAETEAQKWLGNKRHHNRSEWRL
jgi:hypothetical protein